VDRHLDVGVALGAAEDPRLTVVVMMVLNVLRAQRRRERIDALGRADRSHECSPAGMAVEHGDAINAGWQPLRRLPLEACAFAAGRAGGDRGEERVGMVHLPILEGLVLRDRACRSATVNVTFAASCTSLRR